MKIKTVTSDEVRKDERGEQQEIIRKFQLFYTIVFSEK